MTIVYHIRLTYVPLHKILQERKQGSFTNFYPVLHPSFCHFHYTCMPMTKLIKRHTLEYLELCEHLLNLFCSLSLCVMAQSTPIIVLVSSLAPSPTALLGMCTMSQLLPSHAHPAFTIQLTVPHSLSMYKKLNHILPPTPLWCSYQMTMLLIQLPM